MKHTACTYRVSQRGVALMPVILVFASMVVVIGLAFAAISISHGIAVESEYGSSRALHYAEAGLNDALIRLARDRDYLCATDDCYTVAFAPGGCGDGTACAWVSVAQGASSTERVVTSRARSGVNERRLERSFFFDVNMTGKVSGVTWCERDNDALTSPLCRANASSTEIADNVYTLGFTTASGTITTGTITNANVLSTTTGFVATAYTSNGATGTISIDVGAPRTGFGGSQTTSGDPQEIGQTSTSSERVTIIFATPLLVATTTYHSLGNTEFARYRLYHQAGTLLATNDVQGIAAGGAQARTVVASTTAGVFERLEFSAPVGTSNDFLVNTVSYSTGVRYPLNITATPSTNGIVSLIQIAIPTAAILSHGTNNLDGTWTLPLTSQNGYTYTTDMNGGVTITGLRVIRRAATTTAGTVSVTDSTTGDVVSIPFSVGP